MSKTTTWWRVKYNYEIEPVAVARSTEKTVWLNEFDYMGQQRRHPKISDSQSFHPTFSEAKQHARLEIGKKMDAANASAKRHQEKAQRLHTQLAEISILQEPTS